ncbi:hypothetical protein FRC14_003746 [Serendipita sp. 396]|nr:hypothetical protein FRC14_003746 [Serendipita sp. 396]KAG8787699.1 hypothetical protein FRC15_008374 [Serendipita sp. 397]KAG8873963.1 hypothetical protein FRC20_007072 [Serendipita sp. 405]
MHYSSNRLSPKKSNQTKNENKFLQPSAQYASIQQHQLQPNDNKMSSGRSILHRFATEILCHVTSYLDPRSLGTLSCVDQYLRSFMADDVVWKLAFYSGFLGIPPGQEQTSRRIFLLRRSETSYKNEYIGRYNALQRWAGSTTTYIAHRPLLVPVPHIQLLSDGESLLVAPQHLSWVLRTIPSTAKVLKGNFQPTLSNQAHPTNDWRPPTAGAIMSHGGMAKIAWSSQAGDVMVKTAQKAMDPKANRRTSSLASRVADGHDGFINHVSWATSFTGSEFFITSGEDCKVKIWNSETCIAVWTSGYAPDGQPFVRAECDLSTRTAAAVTQKGLVIAWAHLPLGGSESVVSLSTIIPSDDLSRRFSTSNSKLFLNPGPTEVSVIIHSQEDPNAWHLTFDFARGVVGITRLDGPLGPITSSYLDISNRRGEDPILMLGDALSQLSIYDLGQDETDTHADVKLPTTSFTASTKVNTSDAISSITAIATNRIVVVTGDDAGNINVWNAITLQHVRVIMSAELAKDGVGVLSLICQGEQLVASVGRSVLHWKTGATPSRYKKPGKVTKTSMSKSKVKDADVRYHQAIKEFQEELEMTAKKGRAPVYSEREHMTALHSLGLDEASAVEYALMISREESQSASVAPFSGNDFVSALASNSPPSSTETSGSEDDSTSQFSNPSTSPHSRVEETRNLLLGNLKSLRQTAYGQSIDKGQIYPAESTLLETSSWPLSHGHLSSPHTSKRKDNSSVSDSSSARSESVGLGIDDDFPQISVTSTKKPFPNRIKTPMGRSSVSVPIGLAKPAPSMLSNWSTIARRPAAATSGPSSPFTPQNRPPSNNIPTRSAAISYANITPSTVDDEDAQLRYALELSMAEAMSRKEAPNSS